MKILHIITGLSVGGAENMLTKLIEAGTETNKRFQPGVLSMMTPGSIADRIRAQNVAVHSLDMRQGIPPPASLLMLARTTRAIRPDLVLGWMHHGTLAATMASLSVRPRPPVIWNIRHSLVSLEHEKPMTRLVLRAGALLSRTPAAIIYNSRIAARQYEAFGFPVDRTVIIPNGFDIDQFRPRPDARDELCRTFGIDGNATIVGLIARLHPMKDPENLVEAVRRARQGGRDMHLMIMGHGANDPHSPLTRAIHAALPTNRYTTVGHQQDVARWMPGLDIFALSSAWGEGFPNVIGEAMSCGVPCVATDIGDCGWIIGDNGRIVPPRNPDALAGALAWLHDLGTDGRRKMGESARARVAMEFSLPQICRQYEALYDRVLGFASIPEKAASTTAMRAEACVG